jgi:hypothetical protein
VGGVLSAAACLLGFLLPPLLRVEDRPANEAALTPASSAPAAKTPDPTP